MNFVTMKYSRLLPLVLIVLVLGTLVLRMLPAWRIDLTQESLYSLSDGTKNIITGIEEPVTVQFYFSKTVAENFPQLMDYGQRINDLLAEYEALNPDNFLVERIDPEPFSEAEDSATAAGLSGAPISMGGDVFYLGMTVSKTSDAEEIEVSSQGESADESRILEVIEFFNPERERFLEYDVSQTIYRATQAEKPVVGVLTQLQVLGGYDFRTRGMTPAWMALEQLKGFSDVIAVDATSGAITQDVDVLMVIHPQELTDQQLYALDQFVLAGGKALVFVDPHAEIAAQGPGTPNASDMQTLLGAWGVEYNSATIIGDRQWALRVPSAANQMPIPHVGIVALQPEGFDADSLITSELEAINISSAGSLSVKEGAEIEFTPLLQTTGESKQFASMEYLMVRDHGELLVDFEDEGQPLTVAARVSGVVSSAFDGRPENEEPEEGDEQGADQNSKSEALDSQAEPTPAHIETSQAPINVMVVADVDMISDRLWVQVSDFMGQRMAMPWASNGDFIANAVELMAGSEDLISLRSRGQYSRTFTRVNEMRVEAAEKFKQQEQHLTLRLSELENEIATLSPDTNAQNQVVLSGEQQQVIEKFEQERLEVRKELRQVQHHLNSTINALESKLKLINIFLVPVLLLIGLLVVSRLRRHAVR